VLRLIAKLYGLSVVQARSMVKAGTFYFAFVAGVTAFKSATNALFLARRDPTDLPYLYLSTALVITGVTVALGRQLARMPAKPVLRQGVLWVAGLLLALSVLAALDVRPALGALYVAGEAYATAISVLLWARLGEVFDVRSAKRVFGAIAAAGMAGAVIGGMSVKLFAHVVPSAGWCFFAAVSLLVVRPLLGRGVGGGQIHRKKLPVTEGLTYAVKDRYPRGVALLVLLLAVQTAAVDYAFRTRAVVLEGGDEAALASLFGVLNAVVGVGAIVFQFGLTRPLLSRLGVFAFLAVVPLLSLVAVGAAVAWPSAFWPLFTLKTFEMMGSLSLNQPALGLLYNPMPVQSRDAVRALVDGAIKKLGGALGGVLLLVFGAALQGGLLLGLVAALAVLLLVLVRALRPAYLAALERKLGGRHTAAGQGIDVSDRATRDRLLETLGAEDGGRVLAALAVLMRCEGEDLRGHVPRLIHHKDVRVRAQAIALIRAQPDPSYAALLHQILRSDARAPTAEAARALALVDPEGAREALEPLLDAPPGAVDVRLLCAAIEALLPEGLGGHTPGSPKAVERLEALFAHGRAGPPAERRELARLLGHLGPGPFAWRLASYVDDLDRTVQLLAIQSAARARDPALPPKLVHRLEDRRIRRHVIETLAAYGEAVVPFLAETLDDRRLPASLRIHIPRVLRKIGTDAALAAMLFSNVRDDAFLRHVIVQELTRARKERPEARFDHERVKQATLRRLHAYAYYRPIALDLAAGGPAYTLLRRAVEDRLRQNLHNAVSLLGLIFDPATMRSALRGLERGAVADALELLDVTLEGSGLRAEVLRSLEATEISVAPDRAKAQAGALVGGRDIQLAAIAYETLRRMGEDPPEVREPTQGEPLMPSSIVDRVFVLESVQLFHNLSVDDLAAVAELCAEGHADPREVIYREGEPGDSLFVILSGEVHLLREARPVLDLFAGDSFGQVSLLDGGRRPVTAQAGDEGVEYLVLEREPFMDLMVDRPEVVKGLFETLARRLRELVELTGAHNNTGAAKAAPAGSSLPTPALSAR
jgi:hypothetical protein